MGGKQPHQWPSQQFLTQVSETHPHPPDDSSLHLVITLTAEQEPLDLEISHCRVQTAALLMFYGYSPFPECGRSLLCSGGAAAVTAAVHCLHHSCWLMTDKLWCDPDSSSLHSCKPIHLFHPYSSRSSQLFVSSSVLRLQGLLGETGFKMPPEQLAAVAIKASAVPHCPSSFFFLPSFLPFSSSSSSLQ